MFRRLCREAVIFMLLGLLLTSIGSFIYEHRAEAQRLPPCPPPPDFLEADEPTAPPQTPQNTPLQWMKGYVCENSLNHQHVFVVTNDPAPRVKINNVELALTASFFGLYGFAAGLGVWLFYRLVRFAVKG